MKFKTPEELDEMARNKLEDYVTTLQEWLDRAQRELADSVREELDIQFAYDVLKRKYNIVLVEARLMLEETYKVDAITSSQVIREIDQHAAQEAATYPLGGCSG